MAGVDNIVTGILQEAQSAADAILKEAGEKADVIAKEALAQDEKAAQAVSDGAKRTVEELKARAVSQGALRKRQALLKARQAIIDEVIEKAYLRLTAQGDEEYFAMIGTLLEKCVRPGEGTICFNEADLKRIPADFEKSAQQIAEKHGGTIRVSAQPVKIKSGFILSYGGIEENCSLDAIFAEKKDTLRDLANAVLW